MSSCFVCIIDNIKNACQKLCGDKDKINVYINNNNDNDNDTSSHIVYDNNIGSSSSSSSVLTLEEKEINDNYIVTLNISKNIKIITINITQT